MRRPRVRGPLHAVEGKANALLQPERRHVAVEGCGALRPELARPVGGALHAARRHVGIELEGQPADCRRARQPELIEGAFQAALADETPRANNVGEDRDGEQLGH